MSEISPENRSEFNKRYKTTVAVYLALIVLAIVLVAIGWFYAGNVENSVTPSSVMSLRIFVILLAASTIGLKRILMRWGRLMSIALVGGIPKVLNSLQSNAIILGTMAELIAVIGFLIAALNGIRTEMLTFGAIALLLFLINFPRRNIWEKIVIMLEKTEEV